jgi:ribonuclease Z
LGRAGKFLPQKAKDLGVPMNQWKFLQQGQTLQVGDKIVLPEQVLSEPRKGLKFVFTGDTSPCESLTAAAENADLMICEATFGETEQAPVAIRHGHMTFAQAAETAKNANVKQLCLAHFSHRIENPQEYLPNATAIFENTICGTDGMSINLRFQD